MDDIMTINELASYLKLKPRTLYVKVKNREIPGSRIGRTWRFQKHIIDRWLAEKATAKTAPSPQ
jgi:excisionase family DNA binding protein